MIVDIPQIQENLYKYLKLKENVAIHVDSEITSFEKDRNDKKNISGVRCG
jgi:hypothetical protein